MKKIIISCGVMLWFAAMSAHGALVVKISEGESRAQPIAIAKFVENTDDPVDVASIISNDLTLSGFFAPLSRSTVMGLGNPQPGDNINFTAWQTANADNLVIGRVTTHNGERVIEFELIDTLRKQRLLSKRIKMRPGSERRAAHRAADLIYEKLTGNRGYFLTRLAYVEVQRVGAEQLFKLNVSDIDGFNETNVFSSNEPILSPTWSPDTKNLAYVSFETDKPEVWVHNIRNGRRQSVASRPGINGAPAYSPDGRRLAVAMSYNGSLDIYVMDLATRRLQRITNDPAIDTEPSWSPDGTQLVFTSDRSGRQQIYLHDLQSRETKRLTFVGKENARARFAANGEKLVMEHFDNGYKIATYDLSTTNLKVLTSGNLDESPSFSPDGSVVVYARRVGESSQLVIAPTTGEAGGFELQGQGSAVREAAWSPYLPKY